MTEPREIEAKFEIDDPALLIDIRDVPSLQIVGRRHILQADIYLDTHERALQTGGATLRLRDVDGEWTMTFKGRRAAAVAGQQHVASRVEINERVDAGVASTILGGKRSAGRLPPLVLAAELAGEQRLMPIARIRTERTALDLVDAAGLAYELAVDKCHGERLVDGRSIVFNEVELEAKTPDQDALLRASDALRAAVPGLRPSGKTKLARVLG